MEYALTTEALLEFGRRFVRDGGTLASWALFVDRVGPSLLPLVIRPSRYSEIPFGALGYGSVELSALVPQPREMWVLFCYRDSFRSAVDGKTPLRTDGFPLILEWRKDVSDSPLLSVAVHRLAEKVRKQLGVEGWGLCPAYARFGDKVAFTDGALFGDEEGDSSSVASAYGALLMGLSGEVSGRWPPFWTFPTLQWDDERCKPCGVAGLREKLSVAADCGARVVTVAQEQKNFALDLLAKLKMSDDGKRYGKLSVIGSRNVSDPKEFARRLCNDAGRRILALRMAILAAACFFALMIMALGYWFDWEREKITYYADYVERNGVAEGRFPVDGAMMASRGRSYRFHYQGYDSFCPWSRRRVLRAMWCVNGKGALRVDKNDYPEHPPVTGFRYHYDERGRVSEVERCVAGGRVRNVVRYSGDNFEIADIIGVAVGRTTSGKMRFTSAAGGEPVRRIVYVRNRDGYVDEKLFQRDSSGVASSDNSGVSRIAINRLSDGRIEGVRYLDWRGTPVVNAKGVHLERYIYDAERLTRIQYCGLDLKPVCTANQEDERIYRYSQCGNLNVVEKKIGGRLWQRLSYEHDDSGDVVMETFSLTNGVSHSNHWASRKIRMDDGGNVIRETFFDSEGRKLRRRDNLIATVARCFSDNGELSEEALYDEYGKLMLCSEGWAIKKVQFVYRSDGYVVWRRYFGENGRPIIIALGGMACEKKSFDLMGREVEWELFGVEEEKIDGSLGWQRAVIEYDRNGNMSVVRCYDKSGMYIKKEN